MHDILQRGAIQELEVKSTFLLLWRTQVQFPSPTEWLTMFHKIRACILYTYIHANKIVIEARHV